ncbi:hypothetical protein CCACVL1_10178 [Corchorus capsularis]|uniref:Uncharacterized protein n=1 Tax=Corchorus capsularis TaxID=210143 RepID=A0A1R3IS86_COCAP|nr:hypothetical protein CCACVL1_10178 [Corchorus capsularis]
MGEVPPPTPTDPPQKFQKAQLTPSPFLLWSTSTSTPYTSSHTIHTC